MTSPQRRRAKRARGEDGEPILEPSQHLEEPGDEDLLFQPAPQSLGQIGVVELLEQDSRPTFVLDLHTPQREVNGSMNIVWCNKALRFFDELRLVVCTETFYPADQILTPRQETVAAAKIGFKNWATSVPNFDSLVDGYRPRHTYRGLYWTSTTLRGRWRVISASQVPHQRKESSGTPKSSRSVSSSISKSFLSSESAIESALASDETDVSRKLADSESKFKTLTELNPVGMYYLNPAGDILYCNDMWYEITGHPRGLEGEKSFMNVISQLDHELMGKEWELLTTKQGKRVFELRLRNPWYHPVTGECKQKWILASCDQEFNDDGTLKTIMGCITDISLQKHAQKDAEMLAERTQEVADRTREAAEHAKNFQQMAELAPCGMFTFDPEGTITWANNQFFDMTGHSPDQHYPMSLLDFIEEQDREAFRTIWQKLTVAKKESRLELRLKEGARWILFLAVPQLDPENNLTKVFGCTTDISVLKSAEHAEMANRLEAEEAKRQQESFIDMTSHEMRNPLSAIMLCADGIANSVLEYQALQDKTAESSRDLMENNLDAAQTIVLCAQHQKRIIDDVLTLSKLKSSMLHVTPVQVQVEPIVRRTLKMFENEMQVDNIKMSFTVKPCYLNVNIGWVLCDPVRLTQIFINLLTNAIKFTRAEATREISVSLGASVSNPPKDIAPDVQWFPSKGSSVIKDLTLAPEWGTGELIYLYFAVKDTGRGLSEEEKTRLFHRFSQANPKTHVQYGGSGLGLFISRELTELQGGEIGVASKAGKGSTFAFYIKARRSTTIPNPVSRSFGNSGKGITPDLATTNTPSRRHYDYHILLVEDNLVNQKVLSKQLRSTGCVVHVANHGVEALDFLSKTRLWDDGGEVSGESKMKLSIILMDLEMPVMDGLACTRHIRDLEREGIIREHVPVIAVTANTRMEQMEVALEAGMDDIVGKPFQIPELMQKIDGLMVAGVKV